ncbi:uncharacterized protein LOC107857568 [Capsicum annuum]|uniref:uncharacterized protein LOC107857568 n=1 Tax=Capsicum annuum TaxID=4072 RepID=UPI001FB05894|nr:uncharacterized protein LOC107857568 [Capsicum annuum]
MLPHLLLLLDTKGLQLVLVFTLIQQLETTCTIQVHQVREFFMREGINLRSASPTNIDIGFKPSGLKWNGKDAVTSTQLQQMKANKRKNVETAKSSSSIGSSKK